MQIGREFFFFGFGDVGVVSGNIRDWRQTINQRKTFGDCDARIRETERGIERREEIFLLFAELFMDAVLRVLRACFVGKHWEEWFFFLQCL